MIMPFLGCLKAPNERTNNGSQKGSNQGWVGRVNFDQPRDVQVAELMRILPSSMNSGDRKAKLTRVPATWLVGLEAPVAVYKIG